MRARRLAALTVTAVGLVLSLSGCRFDGIGSLPLPFAAGTGPDDYTVTVTLADVGNLVPNSEVKVNDLTVGTVRAVRFQDWQAQLTIGLDRNVRLDADTTATVGQKSLLGAEYLQLSPPVNPAGLPLGSGSHISLSHSGRFPETEEVLAAASLFLNGGGLGQLQTVVAELNNALSGREPLVRQSLTSMRTLASGLEQQREEVERALDSVDRLSGTLARGNQTIDTAIRTLGPGVEVLATQRPDLTQALRDLGKLSQMTDRVVDTSRAGLTNSLSALRPVVRELANSGDDLPQSFGYLTVPFTVGNVPKMFLGDYANAFVTLDLSPTTLGRNFLQKTPLGSIVAGLPKTPSSGTPLLPLPPTIGGAGPPADGSAPGPVRREPTRGGSDSGHAPSSSTPPSPEGGVLRPLLNGGR